MATRTKKDTALTPEEKLQQALVPVEEQPYPVPANWCWTKVGILSSLHRGVSYKKNDAHAVKGANDCLIMRGGNVGEGFIDIEADNVYVDKKLVADNQFVKCNDIIIVASTGSTKVIGRAGISSSSYDDVAFGAFLMLLRPFKDSLPRYMDLFFQSDLYRNRIRDLASGVNINNIRADYITEMPYPLPPLPEQQRIVTRIESLFAKLDEVKEKAQAVVDGYEDRKAAILHKAFTGELTAKWREVNHIDINGWQFKKLSETTIKIIDGDRGKNYPKKDEFSSEGYCIFLNAKNVTKNGFVFDECDYITQEKDKKLHNGRLERGDMVLTTRGTIGNVAVYDETIPYEHLRINSGMVIYRDGFEFSKKYLIWLYQSKLIKNQIRFLRTGTAQPQLPIKVMNALILPIPEINEQNEIVNLIDQMIEKEIQAKEAAESVIDQIDTMKKSVLARAFRGELGTNDPSDEPAIELLKRVLQEQR